jgi:CHRD domain-containing protein
MNNPLITAGLALTFVATSLAVSADDQGRRRERFSATLTGFEETPSTISTGARGTLTLELVTDPLGMALEYELSYEGIEGGAVPPATGAAFAAHIHFGARATSGGVSAFLCGNAVTPVCPVTAGTVTGTIRPASIVGPAGQGIDPGDFDELIRAIRAGVTYGNVHSTPNRTGGEIRGQIKARGNDDDHDRK